MQHSEMSLSYLSGPRKMGPVNWVGLWYLYLKEVYRFLNVYVQTIASPLVTSLLFLAIFTLALGRSVTYVGNFDFLHFITPGLIIMAMAQNAFANTSSSMVISKIQGNIIDVLMPPISPLEFVIAYAAAGITRGLAVGLSCWLGMLLFVPLGVASPVQLLVFSLLGTGMLSLLGLLGGILSDKFDHMAALTNFIITPLSFLSGTFYSIHNLPPLFLMLAKLNPFFYMIDGFRGAFLGSSDVSPLLGFSVLLGFDSSLLLLIWILVRRGYKLKQ